MAEFTVKVPGHEHLEMPAVTCEKCRGLGYVTGEPQRFLVTLMLEDPPVTEERVAKPGDKCLACNGRGWVGIMRTGFRPPPPRLREDLDSR